MIIVDTNIWSLALRRNQVAKEQATGVIYLNYLLDVKEDVVVLGIILQELLSGVRTEKLIAVP